LQRGYKIIASTEVSAGTYLMRVHGPRRSLCSSFKHSRHPKKKKPILVVLYKLLQFLLNFCCINCTHFKLVSDKKTQKTHTTHNHPPSRLGNLCKFYASSSSSAAAAAASSFILVNNM
jgi:hypothetical protein